MMLDSIRKWAPSVQYSEQAPEVGMHVTVQYWHRAKEVTKRGQYIMASGDFTDAIVFLTTGEVLRYRGYDYEEVKRSMKHGCLNWCDDGVKYRIIAVHKPKEFKAFCNYMMRRALYLRDMGRLEDSTIVEIKLAAWEAKHEQVPLGTSATYTDIT